MIFASALPAINETEVDSTLRRTDGMKSDSQIGFVAPTDTNPEVSPAFRRSRNDRPDSKREVLLYIGAFKKFYLTAIPPIILTP